MKYCGLDLGKKSSHFCVMNEKKEIVKEDKVSNREENIVKVFGKLEPMRIAIEASSKAFWIADVLEKCGHVPVVTDPGRTKAIGAAKIKHDKLDAKVLAMLCVADLLVEVNRPTVAQRLGRMPVVARDGLVRSRTMLVNQVRSMLDSEGIIVKPCATEVFVDHVVDMWDDLPTEMGDAIEPVLDTIHALTEEIKACDKKIEKAIKQDEEAKLLMTAPGVGPIVAACFLMAIRDPARFESGRHTGAYLGLVPSLYQSGKTHRRGRITKHGNKQARWALSMAANAVLNPRLKQRSALREWGRSLAKRIGRKKAVVAVARKLASVLWSMLRNQKPFEPRLAEAA
jgi:transposase